MNRELLQQAHTAITDLTEAYNDWYKAAIGDEPTEPNPHCDVLTSIEAAISRSKWVKVADGLPVVPEGKFSARIWAFRADKGKVFRANWWQHYGFQKINFTHWQYRQDDTPAPPEDV